MNTVLKNKENTIKLKIIPEKQLFYNDDSSYGVYSCVPEKEDNKISLSKYGNFTIKGTTFKLTIGQEYNATLKEVFDKKYGRGYEIISINEDIPTDIIKQRGYLLCILTERQVDSIYKTYPDQDILSLIKKDKFDYTKVKGIGKKTYLKIKDKILESMEFQEAFDFLYQFGVSNNMIVKLIKHFKSSKILIQKLNNNPYCMTEVSGIGFIKADAIALKMGYAKDGEFRIKSCIKYVLEEQEMQGHTWVNTEVIIDKVHEIINVDKSIIIKYIENTEEISFMNNNSRATLIKNYKYEQNIATKLLSIQDQSKPLLLNFNIEKFLATQQEKHNINLTEEQKQFFYNVIKNNVNILTASAGCGKSAVQKILIELLEELDVTYKAISPTGMASKVLSNYIERSAETIHKAIGLGLKGEAEKYIEEQFVIIDETSMVGVRLLSKLLDKCKNENLRILFIGDDCQIPSVECGNVLHDLINSKIIPVTRFTKVFRQQEGGILDIATKIRQGISFLDNNFYGIKEFGNDCIIACIPQEKIKDGYKYFIKESLKQYNKNDIVTISSTKKGSLGTVEMNKEIQKIINKKSVDKNEIEYGFNKDIYREQDRVMNTQNAYNLLDVNDDNVNIVNGDVGEIVKIDLEEKEVIIQFDDKIPFSYEELKQIVHAYAITMHKMQGSASKVIIAVIDKSHKFQLNRNLIYTAITRASEKLIILTQAETINYSLRKVVNLSRNTFLQEMIIEYYRQSKNKQLKQYNK